MKLICRTIVLALVAMVWNVGQAQIPEKPAQASPVVDLAGIIKNDSLMSALNAQLDSLSKKTQNQIVVVTVPDLGGLDPKEFATQLGQQWGIGGKALNNGFVMVVKPKTADSSGEIGFATGYGLEGVLPDVFCKRLQTEYMVPHFVDGDYAGGIKAAIDEIVPVVLDDYSKTQTQALASESKKKGGGGNGWFIIAIVLGVIALIVLMRRRSKGSAPQQPQQSQLKSDNEPEKKAEEPKKDKEEKEEEEKDNDDDDTEAPKPANVEEPYKYKYGGGEFGGGGASTKF